MMPISNSQGQALAALIHTLRHDWGLPGINAAIRKAAPLGSATEIALAACRCANNPDMRTPGLIAEPGPHWQGTTAGTRMAPIMCADHPQNKASHCPGCVACAIPRPAYVVVPRPDKLRANPQKPPAPVDLQPARDRLDAQVEP